MLKPVTKKLGELEVGDTFTCHFNEPSEYCTKISDSLDWPHGMGKHKPPCNYVTDSGLISCGQKEDIVYMTEVKSRIKLLMEN